ncbi:MAG: 4-hydroxy-tetrahydrodipicolinate reductase [Flavobacteriales bacterium]|nr:4-hydroxy-tetrahydrodipicolinate reductase [Flavobacteriales bacterium]
MKIALLGYGTMGREIEAIALERGHSIPIKITSQNRSKLTNEDLANCDVAIDFSKPESAVDLIEWSLRNGVPTVSGTTGWLNDWEKIMALRADVNGAFFYASNFSLGVNVFFAVNQRLAELMNPFEDYDVNMTEIHHTRKKDAPSGTAITLAEDVIERVERLQGWTSAREGEINKLPIRSEREGDVPGTHEIVYESFIDKITLRHEAKNRKGFALGAVLAAEWLPGKTGSFGMKDLLNL